MNYLKDGSLKRAQTLRLFFWIGADLWYLMAYYAVRSTCRGLNSFFWLTLYIIPFFLYGPS